MPPCASQPAGAWFSPAPLAPPPHPRSTPAAGPLTPSSTRQAQGIKMVVVGAGEIDYDTLKELSSGPSFTFGGWAPWREGRGLARHSCALHAGPPVTPLPSCWLLNCTMLTTRCLWQSPPPPCPSRRAPAANYNLDSSQLLLLADLASAGVCRELD